MQSGKNWMKMKHKKPGTPEGDAAQGLADPAAAAAAGEPAGAPPATAPAPETKALDDRYLRLMADFENFRKRTLREKSDVYRMANEDLIQDLLPVLDHMELAMKAAQSSGAASAILDGFKMVAEQLTGVMKKFGVEPIEAEGQVFDPTRHEAISHLASDTVPDHVVIQQTRRGYLLGGKLLRAAQVVVSSGPAPLSDVPPPADMPEPKEEE